MSNKSVALMVSLSLLTGSALAGAMGPVSQDPNWSWLSTLSAGPVWENGGAQQSFYLTPSIEKTYTANQTTNTLFAGEFFLGLQKKLSQTLMGQMGLAVATTSNAKLSGYIWDDADPLFANYTYEYKILHTHIAVKGKVLSDMGYWLTPWLSASMGVGFNTAHAFNNTPLIFEVPANANFATRNQTSFSYTLGAGVQKALTKHWQIGVGYEFSDWGKSGLGRTAEQVLNSGLTLNHLYTNGVLFNLSYIA